MKIRQKPQGEKMNKRGCTPKVLLISMPWATLQAPSLQLGILKSVLNIHGIDADVEYLNLYFAAAINTKLYNNLIYGRRQSILCEWLFNANLQKAQETPSVISMRYLDYLNSRLKKKYNLLGQESHGDPLAKYLGNSYREKIKQLKYELIPAFIKNTIQRIDFLQYDIVGFTCCFNQTIPSMAMAKEIKTHHPNIMTIAGGSAFENDMGPEHLKNFQSMDFIVQGEGEKTLPELVKVLRNDKGFNTNNLKSIDGLCWRHKISQDDEKIVVNAMRSPLVDLDQSPIPDYSDYYSTIENITTEKGTKINPSMMYFETSRGCWWGKCTFCAFINHHKKYRSKSTSRVIKEINTLTNKYKQLDFCATDNVLDMRYFKDLLPRLKENGTDITFWYHIRVHITKPKIKLLSEAGIINVQAGIESLHSGPLKLMKKGTLAIENIQLLKWCKQYKINVGYNILFGFPGETNHMYEEMLQTMEKIIHLTPPTYPPIRLEIVRSGSYFRNPENYGIKNVEPKEDYGYIYPKNADLSKVAVLFDPTYINELEDEQFDYIKPITRQLKKWIDVHYNGTNSVKPILMYAIGPEFLVIYDSRSDEGMKTIFLESPSADIYLFCDKIQSIENIFKMIAEKFGRCHSDDNIIAILQDLIEKNLMIYEGNKCLSLAIPIKNAR